MSAEKKGWHDYIANTRVLDGSIDSGQENDAQRAQFRRQAGLLIALFCSLDVLLLYKLTG